MQQQSNYSWNSAVCYLVHRAKTCQCSNIYRSLCITVPPVNDKHMHFIQVKDLSIPTIPVHTHSFLFYVLHPPATPSRSLSLSPFIYLYLLQVPVGVHLTRELWWILRQSLPHTTDSSPILLFIALNCKYLLNEHTLSEHFTSYYMY